MSGRFAKLDGLLLALFGCSFLLGAAGGASLVKLAFPAAATLLALWRASRSPAGYLRLLLWTLILAPGLRHFIDFHTAFSQTNPIMLAPYTVVLAGAPVALLHLLNRGRYATHFLVLILLICIGLGIALASGDITDVLLVGLRWLAPLVAAVYVCAHAERLEEMRGAVLATFRLALPLIGLYGIVQFVSILPWDTYFMKKAPIGSIGYPAPFAVRVFATMNAPGSFAAMLGTGMLLLLPRMRSWSWIGLLLGIVALLLTTQRAALGALTVSILIILMMAQDRRLCATIGKLVVAFAILCVVLLSVPGVAKKLTATASSVTALSKDESARERWKQYEQVLPMLDDHKLGRGLAWSSNPLYINVGTSTPLDSGIIDILISLGLPAGILFITTLFLLLSRAARICRQAADNRAVGEFAAACFGLLQLPFGAQQAAEHGIFLFLALSLLLARGAQQAAMTRSQWLRRMRQRGTPPHPLDLPMQG